MAALLPTLSGVMTAILIVLFAGIVAWAWSGRRRAAFDATARLPLEEDQPGSRPDSDRGPAEHQP